MNLQQLPVFFIDLQTTGPNPNAGEVLEMAWRIRNAGTVSHVIQQERGYIPYRIQAITGLKDHDLLESWSLESAKSEMMTALPENAFAVIHYARFEIPFLKAMFQGLVPFGVLCTHEIAKKLYPNLPTRGLRGLAGFFGFQKEELKRSRSHVEATAIIWEGLIQDLEKQGITTFEELQIWLATPNDSKKSGYEYPLDKKKRLSLPKAPGVYKMLNRKGEILYIGKATSLHSRVNSYFRGQKNRDPRKLEMLTQVWDLEITECRSPLEAALLETDEIKRFDPPYNVSLKAGERSMIFFCRDFSSHSSQQDEIHEVGPFSNPLVLDSIKRLSRSLVNQVFDENMFFDPIPAKLLQKGWELFCLEHSLPMSEAYSVRSLLAMGIGFWKQDKKEWVVEDVQSFQLEDSGSDDDPDDQPLLTEEDVAQKFRRHLVRGARAYLRARAMTKLLNCDLEYSPEVGNQNLSYRIRTHSGRIMGSNELQNSEEGEGLETPCAPLPWRGLTIQDYDRMSILFTELMKVNFQGNIKI